MSIESQIEAAWKDGGEQKLRELFLCNHRSQVLLAGEHGFSAGYRSALRDLYRDSDFDECQDFDWYWVLTDRGWRHAMKTGDYFEIITATGDTEFTCHREDISRIVYTSLPSPSDIFGRGE